MALSQMGISGNTDRLCVVFYTDSDSDLINPGRRESAGVALKFNNSDV